MIEMTQVSPLLARKMLISDATRIPISAMKR